MLMADLRPVCPRAQTELTSRARCEQCRAGEPKLPLDTRTDGPRTLAGIGGAAGPAAARRGPLHPASEGQALSALGGSDFGPEAELSKKVGLPLVGFLSYSPLSLGAPLSLAEGPRNPPLTV